MNVCEHTGLVIPPYAEVDAAIDRRPLLKGARVTMAIGETVSSYTVLSRFGEGSSAEVIAVEPVEPIESDDEYEDYVLKITDPSSQRQSDLEQATHIELNGRPNIVPVLELGRVKREDGWHRSILMPRADGGSLKNQLHKGALDIPTTLELAHSVVGAALALEEHGLVHRDIKAGNILLHGTSWWLTDFGIAEICNVTPATQDITEHLNGRSSYAMETMAGGKALGTPEFMAPEAFLDIPLTNKLDVFSIGSVLYMAITGGGHPFDLRGARSARECRDRFLASGSPRPLSKAIRTAAPKLVTLIEGCLELNPNKRSSLEDAASDLQAM